MPPIDLRRDANLALITLDDGKANALNGASLSALEGALDQAQHADALVIFGRPGFFSAGLDIKTLPGLPTEALVTVLEQFGRVMLRLFVHPRPVVGALTGHAIAGGAVLTLTTDVALAAEGAFRLGLNETVLNIGLPRFIMDLARLRIRPPCLNAVVVEGRLFDPPGALDVGFVEEVLPSDQLRARALERARALAVLPAAYGINKRNLRSAIEKAGREVYAGEVAGFVEFVRGAGK